MTPLAHRPLPFLLALLLLAALPVSVHALGVISDDDCADPEALRDAGGSTGHPPDQERTGMYQGGVIQWSEGDAVPPGPGLFPLRYYVIRSRDAWRIYPEPTRFLRFPFDPERTERAWTASDGVDLPLRVDYGYAQKNVRVAASLLIYDGRPVESLLHMQLGRAWPQLAAGRRPLTLYMVSGVAPIERGVEVETAARAWLAAAWRGYREVCAE